MLDKALFDSIDELLGKVDLENTTSENTGDFPELTDGYYLCTLVKAELAESKSSGQPMVKLQLKTVENGKDVNVDEAGNILINEVNNTKNQTLFMYYVLKDERSVKRFVSDMLKFEGGELGKPVLEKEYFTTAETLEDALDILQGLNIYVMVSTTEKDGEKSTWRNLISWKKIYDLGIDTPF